MESADYKESYVKQAIRFGLDPGYAESLGSYAAKILTAGAVVIHDFYHLAGLLGFHKAELGRLLYSTERYYKTFYIPKKTTGYRKIDAPNRTLKEAQAWILTHILEKLPVLEWTTAFKKGSSILINARKHVRQPIVINVDLEDFFPSITTRQVYGVFRSVGYSPTVSSYLMRLCCKDGALPQGAPTSPTLSNVCARRLDFRLSGLAKKYRFQYSRYADDMTLSGSKEILAKIPFIVWIVEDSGFRINKRKFRVMRSHKRQECTGLVVNSRINTKRERRRYLRQQIYYMKKFGLLSHMERRNENRENIKEVMYGHAYFEMMVNPVLGMKSLEELDEIDWEY